jgi:hypothetical protein
MGRAGTHAVVLLLSLQGCAEKPGEAAPGTGPSASACAGDGECGPEQRCADGRCVARQAASNASAPGASAATPPATAAASGELDCSGPCKQSGRCTAHLGRCVANAADQCSGSEYCASHGFCAHIGESCQVAAQGDGDCNREHGTTKHNPCVDWGRCTAEGGTCVVAGDADCQRYRECARHGYCRARGGRCVK